MEMLYHLHPVKTSQKTSKYVMELCRVPRSRF
jgi:hypothetical protein